MANGNNKKHAAKPLSPLEWAAGAVPILGQTYVAGRLAKEAYKKAARGESKIANYLIPDTPLKIPTLPEGSLAWLQEIEKERAESGRKAAHHAQGLDKRLEQDARAANKKAAAPLDDYIARKKREGSAKGSKSGLSLKDWLAERKAQKEEEKAIDEMRHPEAFKTPEMEKKAALLGGGGPFETDAGGEGQGWSLPSRDDPYDADTSSASSVIPEDVPSTFTGFTGDPSDHKAPPPDIGGLRRQDFGSVASFNRAVSERSPTGGSADRHAAAAQRAMDARGLEKNKAMQSDAYVLGSGSSLRKAPRELGTQSGAMNRAGRRLQRKGAWGEAQKMFGGAEAQRLNEGSRISTPQRRDQEEAERRRGAALMATNTGLSRQMGEEHKKRSNIGQAGSPTSKITQSSRNRR